MYISAVVWFQTYFLFIGKAMAQNPLITVKINSLRYDIQHWRNVKQVLTNKLYDAILMVNFFRTWNTNGYNSAVDGLPDDNPDTSANEAVSEDEFKRKAENFFNKDWSQITDPNSDGTVTQNELADNVAAVMSRVRQIIGEQSFVDGSIDDIDREIKDLSLIQKTT